MCVCVDRFSVFSSDILAITGDPFHYALISHLESQTSYGQRPRKSCLGGKSCYKKLIGFTRHILALYMCLVEQNTFSYSPFITSSLSTALQPRETPCTRNS